MNIHKNACLTPKGREAMARSVLEGEAGFAVGTVFALSALRRMMEAAVASRPRWVEMAERALNSGGHLSGITSGLEGINAKVGGLHKSDLIILAGRPALAQVVHLRAVRGQRQERQFGYLLVWVIVMANLIVDAVRPEQTGVATGMNTVMRSLGGSVGAQIGAHAFVGMYTSLTQDVPPFLTIAGNPTSPYGINAEGLKRRGFPPEAITALKRAYKSLYKSGLSLADARAELARQAEASREIQPLVDFLAASTRGIIR